MIVSYITDIVGSVPEGMEDAVFVLGVIVLMFLLCQVFAFLHAVFKR